MTRLGKIFLAIAASAQTIACTPSPSATTKPGGTKQTGAQEGSGSPSASQMPVIVAGQEFANGDSHCGTDSLFSSGYSRKVDFQLANSFGFKPVCVETSSDLGSNDTMQLNMTFSGNHPSSKEEDLGKLLMWFSAGSPGDDVATYRVERGRRYTMDYTDPSIFISFDPPVASGAGSRPSVDRDRSFLIYHWLPEKGGDPIEIELELYFEGGGFIKGRFSTPYGRP